MVKLIITGCRLGKDVETRTSGDKTIARFSVATDRKYSQEKKTDWYNCVAFGKTATFCESYLKKGSKVNLVGRPTPDRYQNKEGQWVNTFDVVVEEIEFGESKKEAEANQGGFVSEKAEEKPAEKEEEGFMNVPDDVDDSLPFS